MINHIKPQFARYGIPEIIVSDKGPEFSGREFAEFAKQYGFKHVTLSPRYPQCNGFAERAVQTAENILKKAKLEGKDFQLGLLAYRNTPIEEIGLSPAQMLMGRRTRTQLPTTPTLLEPQYPTGNIKSRCLRELGRRHGWGSADFLHFLAVFYFRSMMLKGNIFIFEHLIVYEIRPPPPPPPPQKSAVTDEKSAKIQMLNFGNA